MLDEVIDYDKELEEAGLQDFDNIVLFRIHPDAWGVEGTAQDHGTDKKTYHAIGRYIEYYPLFGNIVLLNTINGEPDVWVEWAWILAGDHTKLAWV